MKYSVTEASVHKSKYFSVFGQRFPTRPEAVKFAEETVARREAAAGRELSRRELEQGIATEDRPLRERINVIPQNEQSFGGTKPKAPATGEANPNALAWAQDALEKAQFTGAMSDVIAAQEAITRVKSGGEPIRPEHAYMMPGDRVTRRSDGRGNDEIVVLRKQDKYDKIISQFPAAEAPAALQQLAQGENN